MPKNNDNLTAEQEQSVTNNQIRKPLKDINAEYIWTVQLKHFFWNSCVKWVAAWAIAYGFIYLLQWYGQANVQGSVNCLQEDVQNGIIQYMRLQPPLEKCEELIYSDHWSITKAQFLFTWFAIFGIPMVLVLNIPFMILYKCKIPFFEQFKISPEVPWPWEQDKEQYTMVKNRAFKQMCFNYLFVSNFNILPVLWYYNWEIPWRWDLILPSVSTIGMQIMFCFIVEDFCFYWSHRTLHMKKPFNLYAYAHKQHHEHIHSVSITAEDVHWIEFYLTNIGILAGPMLLGDKMHYWTFSMWGLCRMVQAQDAHCGYEFPWSFFGLFPLSANATYHEFHHTNNCGNFSSFCTIWDTVFDTSLNYYEKYPEYSQEQNQINDEAAKVQKAEK